MMTALPLSVLLAVPPELENRGLWEKILLLFGGAALGKVTLTVIIIAAIGAAIFFIVSTNKS